MIKNVLWGIVKWNDKGNPFLASTDKRNAIGWIAWNWIDKMEYGFDGLK